MARSDESLPIVPTTHQLGDNVMRAIWNNTVIAESDDTVVVEGNHYFPAAAIHADYFKPSKTTSVCPWKGTASYYSLDVGGKQNADAAWYYPNTKEAANNIQGRCLTIHPSFNLPCANAANAR